MHVHLHRTSLRLIPLHAYLLDATYITFSYVAEQISKYSCGTVLSLEIDL